MSAESDEQKKAYIRALERERRHPQADYAAIDAELERLRGSAKPQAKRAQRRPRKAPETR